MEQAVDVYVYITFFAFISVFYLDNIISLLSIFVWQGYKNPGDHLKSSPTPAFLLLLSSTLVCRYLYRVSVWDAADHKGQEGAEKSALGA